MKKRRLKKWVRNLINYTVAYLFGLVFLILIIFFYI